MKSKISILLIALACSTTVFAYNGDINGNIDSNGIVQGNGVSVHKVPENGSTFLLLGLAATGLAIVAKKRYRK